MLYANWLQHHITLHSFIFLPATALWLSGLALARWQRREGNIAKCPWRWWPGAVEIQYPTVASEKAYEA